LRFGRSPFAFLLWLQGREQLAGRQRAKAANRSSFPNSPQMFFKPMDGGTNLALTEDEIKGRNTWNLWCGGTEQFWDRMARESYGMIDLLKTIDSRKRGTSIQGPGIN
jgi:hypothetical protein